jgi:pyruvate dehydrogenase E1 component beta subunit
MGEEVGHYQGAYKVSQGLLEEFGERRVIDTPIAEMGFAGVGVGAAMVGLRPIIEFMTFNFSLVAIDQIVNNAAKIYQMSAGQFHIPIVFRGPGGPALQVASQHSQALESMYCHVPGLKVVMPSTAYDAKGLLKSAIRDDNPVLFVESQALYNMRGPVPEEEYLEPLGKAAVRREGSDVTIVAWSLLAHMMMEAGEELASEHGIDAELIDLRTLIPLDMETILQSVRKTGRCIVACQACRTGSFTAEVAARVQEEAFDYLDAPVMRIGSADAISPQSEVLEKAYLPGPAEIVTAARAVCYAEGE